MIESFHIRRCVEFEYNKNIEIISDDKILLKMTPKKSIFIESKKVIPFKCSFRKEITQNIMIEEKIYESYIIPTDFKSYYFVDDKILFLNLSKTTATSFIKMLEKEENYTFEKIEFDLKKILENDKTQSRGMFFKNSDVYVRSKSFHGINVEKDREADKALNDDKVTYISVSLDIDNVSKTINISKNSSISVVSKCTNDESYLNLVYKAFNIIKKLI